MNVNSPEEAEEVLDQITSYTNPCTTLHELLDLMGQNRDLYKVQIARACALIPQLGCEPHSVCEIPA